MNEILDEAETFLKSQGCDDESIKKQLTRIKRHPHNPRKKLKSKRVWLVTWERTNSNSEVVSIINSRKSAESVHEFVEQLYISSVYSDLEKLTYARCPKDNPYPAEFGRINGVRWLGRITCDHNPFLLARIVINLAVNIDGSSVEHLVWEEIETPNMQPL